MAKCFGIEQQSTCWVRLMNRGPRRMAASPRRGFAWRLVAALGVAYSGQRHAGDEQEDGGQAVESVGQAEQAVGGTEQALAQQHRQCREHAAVSDWAGAANTGLASVIRPALASMRPSTSSRAAHGRLLVAGAGSVAGSVCEALASAASGASASQPPAERPRWRGDRWPQPPAECHRWPQPPAARRRGESVTAAACGASPAERATAASRRRRRRDEGAHGIAELPSAGAAADPASSLALGRPSSRRYAKKASSALSIAFEARATVGHR